MRSIPQRQGSFPHSSQMTRWLRDLIPMNDQVGTNSAAISQFFPGLLSVSGVFGLCKSFVCSNGTRSVQVTNDTPSQKRDAVSISLGFFFFFFSFRGFIKEKVWSHFSLYKFQCVGQDESRARFGHAGIKLRDAVSATSRCLSQKKKTNKKKIQAARRYAAPLQAVPVLFIYNGMHVWRMTNAGPLETNGIPRELENSREHDNVTELDMVYIKRRHKPRRLLLSLKQQQMEWLRVICASACRSIRSCLLFNYSFLNWNPV